MKKCSALLLILLLLAQVAPASTERVLRVWNCFADQRFYEAALRTEQHFPGLRVEECGEMDDRKLINRLFSRDPAIDIICFQDWNNGISGQYLLKSGMLEDLSGYEALSSLRQDLLGVIHVFEQGMQWFGIPNNMTVSLWYGNTALFEALGLPFPAEHWTWEDVYALGEQVHRINEERGTAYKLIYEDNVSPYVLRQYLYNTTDYVNGTHQLDSETFRTLMEQWMQLRAWGVCGEIQDRKSEVGERKVIADTLICIDEKTFGTSGLPIVDPAIRTGDERQLFRMILPPSADGFCKGLVQAYGLGMTVFSDHKEEAAYFLACYMECMRRDMLDVNGIYTDGMGNFGPVNAENVDLSDTGFAEGTWARENVEHWLRYADDCQGEYYDENMAVNVKNLLYWELRDGVISMDEYISRCIDIANRYLGE